MATIFERIEKRKRNALCLHVLRFVAANVSEMIALKQAKRTTKKRPHL